MLSHCLICWFAFVVWNVHGEVMLLTATWKACCVLRVTVCVCASILPRGKVSHGQKADCLLPLFLGRWRKQGIAASTQIPQKMQIIPQKKHIHDSAIFHCMGQAGNRKFKVLWLSPPCSCSLEVTLPVAKGWHHAAASNKAALWTDKIQGHEGSLLTPNSLTAHPSHFLPPTHTQHSLPCQHKHGKTGL